MASSAISHRPSHQEIPESIDGRNEQEASTKNEVSAIKTLFQQMIQFPNKTPEVISGEDYKRFLIHALILSQSSCLKTTTVFVSSDDSENTEIAKKLSETFVSDDSKNTEILKTLSEFDANLINDDFLNSKFMEIANNHNLSNFDLLKLIKSRITNSELQDPNLQNAFRQLRLILMVLKVQDTPKKLASSSSNSNNGLIHLNIRTFEE